MPSLLSGLRHHCCNKCNQAQWGPVWARYSKLEQLLGSIDNEYNFRDSLVHLDQQYSSHSYVTLVVYVTYTHYKSKT